MAGFEDYQFQAPNARPPLSFDDEGHPLQRLGLIVVAVAIFAIAGYLVFGGKSTPTRAPAPVAKTAPPQVPKALVQEQAEQITLPPLDQSDPLVRQRIGILSSHPLVSAWLATSGLIRNFVVVVDNIARGHAPSKYLGVLRPRGTFRVATRGNRLVIDPRNYDRYSNIVGAATSIDPKAAARTFLTFKPLLQMAYEELGSQEPINAAVERAIVALLRVPAPDGDVRLEQRQGVGYEYADPDLATLNPAQKQLLRMGAANIRAIQQQLRLFGLALGITAERLS